MRATAHLQDHRHCPHPTGPGTYDNCNANHTTGSAAIVDGNAQAIDLRDLHPLSHVQTDAQNMIPSTR